MIRVQRGTDGEAFIARRRLNVCVAKRRAVKQLAVSDAVESASSSHGEVIERHTRVQLVQQMKKYFFKALLHGKGQVHITLDDLGVQRARATEEFFHTIGKMPRQLDSPVGQHLHALITSQRFE